MKELLTTMANIINANGGSIDNWGHIINRDTFKNVVEFRLKGGGKDSTIPGVIEDI